MERMIAVATVAETRPVDTVQIRVLTVEGVRVMMELDDQRSSDLPSVQLTRQTRNNDDDF